MTISREESNELTDDDWNDMVISTDELRAVKYTQADINAAVAAVREKNEYQCEWKPSSFDLATRYHVECEILYKKLIVEADARGIDRWELKHAINNWNGAKEE